MTDKERHSLIKDLREASDMHVIHWVRVKAADEIERLAKELANANRLLEINRRKSLEKSGGLEIKQSDAEQAAHEMGIKEGDPLWTTDMSREDVFNAGYNTALARQSAAEPVAWRNPAPDAAPSAYSNVKTVTIDCTVPPRPDTSEGLIEAAEELADLMDDVVQGNYKPDSFTTQPLRKALRARDRSGK